MQIEPHYDDVVKEVRQFLVRRADEAEAAGVPEIWIDPGIGFGKGLGHNLSLLRHLDQLVATGRPVVVGTSRKSFLGRLVAGPGAPPAPIEDRLAGSLASAVWAMTQGAGMVRVHDVAPTVQAVRIVGETTMVPSQADERVGA
jgi:dihydropteroate synthase